MDERDEYEPEGEAPAEPVTERVRIIGAQPAGTVAGREAEDAGPTEPRLPLTPAAAPPSAHPGSGSGPKKTAETGPVGPLHAEEAGRSAPSGRNGGDPLEPAAPAPGLGEAAGVPDMPHWTDPPTGQVPAVLDRRGDDEGSWAAAGDPGPAWREHSHEWEDTGFDPSLLADEETSVGALTETPVEERRPWEFHDLGKTADERGTEEVVGGGSWWDEGEEEPAPVTLGRSPATTAFASPPERASAADADAGTEPAERVASISSSPLRVGSRETPSAAAATGRGRLGRGPLVPGSGRERGEGSGRDLPVAIATGVGFVLVALLCFELGTVATLVLSAVVVALAAAECYAALRRSGRRPATLLGLVGTVVLMIETYAKGIAALPLVLVLMVVASMIWYLVGAEHGSAVEGVTSTLLGFVWVGVLGSFAALMLAPSQYPHRHGIAFMLGAVVAAVGADVGGLAIGSWLGRHPLAPHVSPNKTWEGVIGGGLVAVVVSAAITGQVHPWTVPKAALLGVVVAVVAPLGDLCESLVKRDLGLKDMGSMLPGHGGVLDRVDAILFVLPATYYLVRVLNLG